MAKARVDIAVRPSGDIRSVDYDELGVSGLVEQLQALGPTAVLLEATGRLAKTDALDAQVLTHFAEAMRPPVRQLRDGGAQELNAMTTRRNQVMTMLVAEKNRLSRSVPSVRPSVQNHIAWLEQQLKDLDDGLRQTLRRSPVWREKDDLLRSVPGVGEQLSLSLLA